MYNKVQPPLMTTPKSGGKSPHCKVCGDESSGFHYGVDSCEGCKGFFRRCITQGMTHKCANEEKCEITPFTRNSCQYCRLKKCFSVGMSREASRLGRRPKRLKDVSGDSSRSHQVNLPIAPYPSPAELYRLRMAELQKLLQANGTFKSELMQAFLSAAQASFREHAKNTTSSPTSTTSGTSTNLQDPNQNTYTPGMLQFGTESGYSSMSSPASSKSQSPLHDNTQQQMLGNNNNQMMDNTGINTVAPSTNYNANTAMMQQHQQQQQHTMAMTSTQMANTNLSPSQISNPHMSTMAMPMSTTGSKSSPSSTNLNANTMAMPYIVTPESPVTIKTEPTSTGACDIPDSNGNPAMQVLRQLEEVKMTPSENRQQLIEQVQEAVTSAHFSTNLNTYKTVAEAMDRIKNSNEPMPIPDMSKLSLNADSMWQGFVSQMVPEITRVVKFCKKLPGFAEIEQEDQIKLIKQGSFEVMMIRFTMLVDPISGEMLDPTHKMVCPRAVIISMPMGSFFEEFFKVAAQINPLCLTDSEIGMFAACLIMSPDRKGLKNMKAIVKIQSLFLQSLFLKLRENHEDPETLFLKLMTSIPVLRAINEEHSKAINNIKMMNPGTYEDVFPALHQEVFDGTL